MKYFMLVLFSVFTFSTSILYFYLFSKKQEMFMKYWGFSWITYTFSLLLLVFGLATEVDFFFMCRKVVDMFNLLLLLFGSYAFMHRKIPAFWHRFSLYLLLLALICIIYEFELLSFYLPISIYQLILTGFICYNVVKLWNMPLKERLLSMSVFLIWGTTKSVLSIIEVFAGGSYLLYISDIIFFSMVNLFLLFIYIMYNDNEDRMADNLYETVVKNSSDTIFYYRLRPFEAFEYISPSVISVTGYSQEEFYDDPKRFVSLAESGYRDKIDDLFSRKPAYDDVVVAEMNDRNGDRFWGEFTCSLIDNDPALGPAAIEGTFRDITKLKSAELEQINATRSRNTLLSYISHELRTPITSIAGYITAINDGTMENEKEKEEAMEIITSKTFTLKKLIDDLDQLSKLETHQFTFDFMSYTALEMTEMMLAGTIADLRTSGFEVKTDFDERILGDSWLIADSDRINQVFTNLITNAKKYSAQRKEIKLTFSIDEAKENFIVSVKDSGIGIRESQIPYIFDRFYRTGQDKQQKEAVEGRGLGLTLCKEIITAHQGTIYAESIYGSGSNFTFTLPLYKEE